MSTRVDPAKYPKIRDWNEKVLTMPNIPRGSAGLIAVLKDILTKVKNDFSPKQILSFDGSNTKITLDELCVRLRPMRLVKKTQIGWELTEESKYWIECEDNLYLAAILCANVRFLSEILYFLDMPRKSNELNDIAINEYGLGWKTLSSINSCLVWLRQLALVEYQSFSMLYSITELGREFIKNIEVVDSIRTAPLSDETVNEHNVPVREWAIQCCENGREELALRKQSIGYIPGDVQNFAETIAEYLNLIRSGADLDAIRSFAKSNYGIAFSSLRSFMTTLTNLGFVERKTDQLYITTETAEEWLKNKCEVEAVCCLHNKFLFIFELLYELEGKSLTYKELAVQAKVSYGVEKENIAEIQRRIGIFKSAKLVRNTSLDEFTITERGKKIIKLIPLQAPNTTMPHESPSAYTYAYALLCAELRVSSKDSSSPDRFERAVKDAFNALGFIAEKLGGSGKTDVLIHAPGAPKYAFTATVDAKSSASGKISENLIDFDTLKEHRKKHGADFSIVVGCSFQNERLIKRAEEHNVVLLDVDSLEKMIRQQANIPTNVSSYKKIFQKSGIVDIELIDADCRQVARFGVLIHAVMDCLLEESSDEVTMGLLMERDVYRSLRDIEGLDESLTIDEISDMLKLLSSPLIGCVEKTKDGYFAVGSLSDVARRLMYYSKTCINNLRH